MKNFNEQLNQQFQLMCATGKLFRSELGGSQVWKLYLKSFPEDPMFRDPESSEHNCNLCNNFIRRYGNIVALDTDYNIITLFDIVTDSEEFAPVALALSTAIRNSKISNIFFETFAELNLLPYEKCTKTTPNFLLGVDKNVKRYTKEEAEKFGVVKPNEIRTFNHLHMFLPNAFVDTTGASIESISAGYRDAKNVFERGMESISLDTLNLVKDLINQGSLLDGVTHLFKIEQMIPLKVIYDALPASARSNWCWVASYKLPFAKFRNELIGTLCSDLSEGEEINKACQTWNKRVDPVNYMKTTAPITKKQIAEAKAFVEDNGYTASFNRRLAVIDDIKASEIMHINSGKGDIKEVSIFDNVKSTSTRHKRNEFDGVEEVGIEKFMKDILPGCTSVEAFLANNHDGNLVTLTTSNSEDSKPIFKWDNNYSKTFNGNLAGKSMIKDAVKTKGGKVDGVLRFSIMWAEDDPTDQSDLDAWCVQPNGKRIGYSSKRDGITGGELDIDITDPSRYKNKNIVENITWPTLGKMVDGEYKFQINQYSDSGSKGFRAEIEFNGEVYSYEYNKAVKGNVRVAKVTLKNGVFTIEHLLPETTSSKVMYGLDTNQFHKVNLMCLSPNHWGDNNVGNKYYLFMLDKCKAPTAVRGFHNEDLIPELAQHRKVLEVLGATSMIETSDKQLSGLGFNATVHDELIVKLEGNFKRMVKIKF